MTFEQEKDVVIFKGSGKVFCAGGDVKNVANTKVESIKNSYKISSRTYDSLMNYKKPFVVLADGLAMGGAAIYLMPAKYRVATERTSFSMPETAIGYFNDAGASYFLPRLPKSFGVYMGMTGVRVNGFDMKKIGLASHFIESTKLDELEKALISCATHQQVEQTLNHFESNPENSESELDLILPRIEKCFGASTVEEIYKNLKQDESDWAKQTLKILNKMSPTSLKVTHRSINSGKTLTLRECMKMEICLVVQHLIDSDFKEGCRAALVDKDFKPSWNPQTLSEVTDRRVERFFKPLPDGDELTFEPELKNKL
jgi:3-hydroxyisobutyryl-CoA hydrolase